MGFFVAAMAMVSACVLQYYIYKLSACPDNHVNEGTYNDINCTAPINVWVQALPYCLIAFSEIGASISTLEYAYSKAPENMRGLVMGVNLFSNAISAAIGQALVPLADDPLLICSYTRLSCHRVPLTISRELRRCRCNRLRWRYCLLGHVEGPRLQGGRVELDPGFGLQGPESVRGGPRAPRQRPCTRG